MTTIPRGKAFPHLNFKEQFGVAAVAPRLERLQGYLADDTVEGVVLNFEKCQWFELLPLARLLAILCCSPRKPILHIVAPALEALPWHGSYVRTLVKRLEEIDSAENGGQTAREHLQGRIKWFGGDHLPLLRQKAGAFLLGWGVLDLLEDRYRDCRWYLSRSKISSLAELRETFLFAYGSTAGARGTTSDRIWPFTWLGEADQGEIMARLNGEELLAGPLRALAKSKVLRSGAASNIFFYEPLENVFLHAYPRAKPTEGAIVSMRIVGPLRNPKKRSQDARAPWRRLSAWESPFFARYPETPFLEMVVVDNGVGIPGTLREEWERDLSYRQSRIPIEGQVVSENIRSAWEVIRYAFEEHSGRRLDPPPGLRGLSWVKTKLLEYEGALIEVQSQGASFVAWSDGESLNEIPWEESSKPFLTLADPHSLKGTAVRLLLPLREDPATPSRLLAWPEKAVASYAEQTSLFGPNREPAFYVQTVPPDIAAEKVSDQKAWGVFLGSLAETLAKVESSAFMVLDLAGLTLSRGVLEGFFGAFILCSSLHGRLLLINCNRHMASRFDTVSAALRLEQESLLLPFFDPDLALYWVGAASRNEGALLELFARTGPETAALKLRTFAEKNPGLFRHPVGDRPRFTIDLSHVEALVRRRLGERLHAMLGKREALNVGRYLLPLSQHTVPLYVEPHQIFVDPELATELCRHLALVLRRRYRERLSPPEKRSFRVLTATRIGRDIAMWMPEGFPRQVFVFFDSHLVRPEKPRLQKLLQDGRVVIVVDIVSSGTVVSQLLTVCRDAGAYVLGIVSLIDFSPAAAEGAEIQVSQGFQVPGGQSVEHLTFWRFPQQLLVPRSDDIQVDPLTLSISPPPLLESASGGRAAKLEREQALRLMVDAQILHHGHFDLFGRHNEFATNLPRLFSAPSYLHDEVCRACEEAIFNQDGNLPVAVVLYPDLSHCHLLQAALAQRPRLRQAQREDRIKVVEARRASRAFGRRYWLTNQELATLRTWAASHYPDGFSVLLLDDAASSGETLLALLELSRALEPAEVHAFVIQNRMPQFRTGHHEEIERFAWASSRFSSFLSLNLPTFTRDNCPLCRERSELASERRAAHGEWLREALQRRLERLEVFSTLNAHDLPKGPLAEKLEGFRGFDWDEGNALGFEDLPAIVWAMSARLAIYRGVGLLEVFDAISGVSDDAWRVTVLEIARRNDLQQAQGVEDRLIERLRRVLQDGRDRRSFALEALRFFRPETLLPQLERIVEITLEGLVTDDVLVELYLLLRRVLSYRHLQASQVVEQEASIGIKLDELRSREHRGTRRHTQLDRLRGEWSNLAFQQDDLVSVVRDLDVILKPSLDLDHRLTTSLHTYLPQSSEAWGFEFQEYMHKAFKAIRLSERLIPLLDKASATLPESLPAIVETGAKAFQVFRSDLVSLRQADPEVHRQQLTDCVDTLEKALDAVADEIRRLAIIPVVALRKTLEKFKSDHAQVHCAVVISDSALPPNTRIFIDPALYQDIVQNVVGNLRHAIDGDRGRVEATLALSLRDALGDGWVELRISCGTRAQKGLDASAAKSTGHFVRLARFFGADHYVKPESWDSLENPWEEIWTFRRLGS